jgi:hypothetical protein
MVSLLTTLATLATLATLTTLATLLGQPKQVRCRLGNTAGTLTHTTDGLTKCTY